MSILVRDEADVIEWNIRFHASQGVDYFIVMDNGSTDGTREILENLRSDVDLEILDEPSRSFDQDLWVTKMAFHVRETSRADFMIAADADEFWHSNTGTLKSDFQTSHAASGHGKWGDGSADNSVFLCSRYNMLPRFTDLKIPHYMFSDNIMKVARPFGIHKNAPDPEEKLDFGIMLRTMPAKVMCSLKGLKSVGMGNHSVEHESGAPVQSPTIQIYHYPLRTYAQFEKKVVNQGAALTSNKRFDEGTGWHTRRWYALYRQGKLREEYELMVLQDQQMRDLIRRGILQEDFTLKNALQSLEGQGNGGSMSLSPGKE